MSWSKDIVSLLLVEVLLCNITLGVTSVSSVLKVLLYVNLNQERKTVNNRSFGPWLTQESYQINRTFPPVVIHEVSSMLLQNFLLCQQGFIGSP